MNELSRADYIQWGMTLEASLRKLHWEIPRPATVGIDPLDIRFYCQNFIASILDEPDRKVDTPEMMFFAEHPSCTALSQWADLSVDQFRELASAHTQSQWAVLAIALHAHAPQESKIAETESLIAMCQTVNAMPPEFWEASLSAYFTKGN